THAKLTDSGESLARAAAGVPGLRDAWAAWRRVVELTKFDGTLLTDRWINECRVVDAKYGVAEDGPRLSALELRMLPALSRRHVPSNSDAHGRVYYWAARGTGDRPEAVRAKHVDDACDYSVAARDEASRRLHDERSDFARRIVIIRLPVSNEGLA